MPSDFEPIAKTACCGCGRDGGQVALKRLNTYSRSFSCLDCYLKYSNCANCQHPKHGEDRPVALRLKDMGHSCFCGCREYAHGLEGEYHRQFAEHTGKAPAQRRCNHCGNWFDERSESGGLLLWCKNCESERRAIGG